MKKTFLLGLTAITLALTSSTARAGDVRFSFHIGLPLPVPRVYVAAPAPPPPVYVAPPVVYVPGSYYYPGYTHYGYRGYPRYIRTYAPCHVHRGYYCRH